MDFKGLKPEYQILKKDILPHLDALMESGTFIMGPEVECLEKTLAAFVKVNYCLSCASGTDALLLALMALNVQPGDLILTPAYSYIASASCITRLGAIPVFVDVDERTYNISPQSLTDNIAALKAEGKECKGIITVDLFGLPADYSKIMKIAQDNRLFVLEDCAQGFGSRVVDKMACSFGDIAITSFFPAKPFGCYGDGGAIFTNNHDLAEKIWSLRSHGRTRKNKYENIRTGINSRLDTLQAAVLLEKFDYYIDFELGQLATIASFYTNKLTNYVKTPYVPEGFSSSWAQYTIVLKNEMDRDALKDYLKKHFVPTMIYYPIPLHRQEAMKGFSCYSPLNKSELLSRTALSLPIHPFLNSEEQLLVVNSVIAFLKKRNYG